MATGLLVLLAGCGSAVEVASPSLEGDERSRCEALVAQLPDRLFDQERRDVEPDDGVTAAWGDPAVVLVCGADQPREYDQFASCTPIGGAGWFMPDTQLRETGAPITITAMSHTPRLQVVVPAGLRDRGPDSALVTLGPLVAEHLAETLPCH